MFCRGRAAGCEAALCWRGGGRAPNEAGADGCLDRQLFRSALCRVSPSCLGSELPAQTSPDTDASDGNRRWLVEECGVDIESPDRSGVTPLQAACENGHVDVASYICSLPCTPAVALRRRVLPGAFAHQPECSSSAHSPRYPWTAGAPSAPPRRHLPPNPRSAHTRPSRRLAARGAAPSRPPEGCYRST